MNLDNCTFLGDFEDTHTLRLLDGTVTEMRVNMINDEDISGVIIDAAKACGVELHRHRLNYATDPENPRLYLAYQDPPNRFHFSIAGLNNLTIQSVPNLTDAVDFFEAFDPKTLNPIYDYIGDPHTLKLQINPYLFAELQGNTNHLQEKLFSRLMDQVMEKFEYTHIQMDNKIPLPLLKVVQSVCKTSESITKLTMMRLSRSPNAGEFEQFINGLEGTHITELVLPTEDMLADFTKREWGGFLAEKTNVQTIRFSVRASFANEISSMQQSVGLHLHQVWPHWKVKFDRTEEVDHFLYGMYYQVWFILQRGFTLSSEWGVWLEDDNMVQENNTGLPRTPIDLI